MAAPQFVPTDPVERARSYASPAHVPEGWTPGRPAELDAHQPQGDRLGYQGPDQGYALRIAAHLTPSVRVQPGESAADAIEGCLGVALRRASLFGRAPVVHDLRIALTIWGFLDTTPPSELVALRRPVFEGVAHTLHHYAEGRGIADSVPEATLRMTPGDVETAYPARWRDLLAR
jgi:hypothetical protein